LQCYFPMNDMLSSSWFVSLLLNSSLWIQVSALDKATGKSQKITITADKGRFSQDEIDRMIREAEENAEADNAQRKRVEAKNALESYLYNVKSTMADTTATGLRSKLEPTDVETVETSISGGLQWLDEHASDSEESISAKKAEIEAVVGPIMSKAYQQQAPSEQQPAGGDSAASGAGPSVEEL
jgi:heat shock protein 5